MAVICKNCNEVMRRQCLILHTWMHIVYCKAKPIGLFESASPKYFYVFGEDAEPEIYNAPDEVYDEDYIAELGRLIGS